MAFTQGISHKNNNGWRDLNQTTITFSDYRFYLNGSSSIHLRKNKQAVPIFNH